MFLFVVCLFAVVEEGMYISATNLSKTIGGRVLFEGVNFKISAGDKIGLIGPNGAGKSTLIKMISGHYESDTGDILRAKHMKVAYLSQTEEFDPDQTLESIIIQSLDGDSTLDEHDKITRAAIHLGRLGFENPYEQVKNLSGGWQKRLAIAGQLAKDPDVLLLDEPTNHLDLEGISWLETLLKNAKFAFVVISHDRTFLENAVTSVVEVNDCFPEGTFRSEGNYSTFLRHRKAFLEAQLSALESAASKARREDAWLKQGIKARGTRAKARMGNADELFDEVQSLKARTVEPKRIKLEFQETERKTKRLISAHRISKAYDDKKLIDKLDLTLIPKMRLGLIGYNGSGKTTLMKMLCGEINPDEGTVTTANGIRVAVFDQSRKLVDKNQTLQEALTPNGGDGVIYQDKLVHVASWAKRLKFRHDQLQTPVSALSGGEQARILLGQLMLTKADVLFLDEPTNDLDIPSLEVLEESLSSFPGAIVLVTHDREMLDRVSTVLLGLNGGGHVTPYASVAQWQSDIQGASLAKNSEKVASKKKADDQKNKSEETLRDQKAARGKLSYKEQQEFDRMEEAILEAETELDDLQKNPETDVEYYQRLAEVQQEVERLYARWEELSSRA